MPDPLANAFSGEPSPFLTDTTTVNETLEVVRQYRRMQRGGGGPMEALKIVPATLVWVRNDTGAALDEFSPLLPGEPIISAVDYPLGFRDQPAFPGTNPTSATDVFFITVEPLEVDGCGRAASLGVVPADVAILDSTHTYAVPAVNSTTTSASLVVPIVGGSVVASVLATSWMVVGNELSFTDGTHTFTGSISSLTSTTVTVTCTAIVAGQPAATLASGATVKFTAKLVSASGGTARIVWRESGSSGTKRAVLLLSGVAPSSAALTSGYVLATLNYDITSDANWQNTGGSFSLPSAGTYYLFGTVGTHATMTGMGAAELKGVAIRLYDVTNATDIELTYMTGAEISTNAMNAGRFATIAALLTVASGITIRLEAFRSAAGAGTWTLARIEETGLGYLKVG